MSYGDQGRLAVGFSASLTGGNLRATISDYLLRFPDLQFDAVEADAERRRNALQLRMFDVVISAADISEAGITKVPVWPERVSRKRESSWHRSFTAGGWPCGRRKRGSAQHTPGRAVPRRERRPPRLAGAAPTTPARQRRPQTRSCHYESERPARMAKAKDSRPERRRVSLR